jgi:hypothetical protein
VHAATVTGHHVVQRQVSRLFPAVLAREPVAQENVAPGQASLGPRAADQVDQPDNRGDLVDRRRAVQVPTAVFDGFGFAAVKQDECPAYVTYVQGLVILVQYQYR